MPKGIRLVWVVVLTVAIWGVHFESAEASERKLVSCRVQKLLSNHEFEEGLDIRHNPVVDVYQTGTGSKVDYVVQLGGFQDFDSYRGDRIGFKSTRTSDVVIARYREFQWSIQVVISKTAIGKSGLRAGVLTYQEEPRSERITVAELGCK